MRNQKEYNKLDTILNEVERELNIGLSNKKRTREYVYARAIYYKIAEELTRLKHDQIAKRVNKDRLSARHGILVTFQEVKQYEDYYYNLYLLIRENIEYKLSKKYSFEVKNINLVENIIEYC